MARSPIKTASESDVTPAAEETLDFDDVTLRGEMKHVCYLPRHLPQVDTILSVTLVAVNKHGSIVAETFYFFSLYYSRCCKLVHFRIFLNF